jgi:uncharacterized protein YggE
MDEARTKAAAEARKNAELYVSAAGAQLGPVLSITDVQSARPEPLFRYDAESKMSGQSPLVIAAGEQELTVNVTIKFAINQPTLKNRLPLEDVIQSANPN